jgi:Xaa-Pro aminopeptidase
MTDSRKNLVDSIRKEMIREDLDAYIVPFTDPHQSEYIPEHWKFREWVSGFTGSAGVVVITLQFAGLWTDSRYFLQAEQELQGSDIQLVKLKIPHTPEYIGWLKENLPDGSLVGLDNRYFTASLIRSLTESLETSGIFLNEDIDILTPLWTNRPGLPCNPVYDHPVAFCGISRTEKIHQIRQQLINDKIDYQFIAPLDEIAWLFNLRGSDVKYCPVFVAFAIIGLHDCHLFADLNAFPDSLLANLRHDGVTVRDYSDILPWISEIPLDSVCGMASDKTTGSLFEALSSRARIMDDMNVTTALKAIKNPVEISSLKNVMVRDGIAWVKTLYWIQDAILRGHPLTEISIARKIAAFRTDQDGYKGESFHPISSFGPHGAVVHYSVTEESSVPLEPAGIYLLDCGGQFIDGTTDTTRTITLGQPTPDQITDFTLALKGTLGVSMLRFPKGTKGYQIDILARMALWQKGKNYGHGTGHGVGFFLNVHEGPQTIGTSASGYLNVTLDPGMVTTVEPAIYKDGEYGMRTENMTLVVPDCETAYGTFYRFETLTLVPIDRNLIDVSLLTPSEIKWIDDYHERVWNQLGDHLSQEERRWLRNATLPLIS